MFIFGKAYCCHFTSFPSLFFYGYITSCSQNMSSNTGAPHHLVVATCCTDEAQSVLIVRSIGLIVPMSLKKRKYYLFLISFMFVQILF